uniref:SVOP-like n=1 Tax=Callorhinchus milii TaxID=7868 RepID=A0A4W3HM47_CALMI
VSSSKRRNKMAFRTKAQINYIHLDEHPATPREKGASVRSRIKGPAKTFTVDEAVEHIGFGRFHILLLCIMGSTSVTMEIMLLAVMSPAIRCEWRLEEWQVALVTTMVFFGFMVFSGIWGFFADRYGRWKILLLVTVWSSYYSLVTSFAHTYVWFIFLRSMVGCGVAGHSQGFFYLSTFSAAFTCSYLFFQIFWLLGSTLEILLAYLIIPTLGWRWLVRISTFPSIVLLVVFKCIPESARFNVSVGNTQIATQTLQYIAKMNRVSLPRGSLVESGLVSTESRGQFLDLLDSGYRRTTLQLGSAFSYYGLVLTSSELLENNPICNSLESAESLHIKSVEICHCKMFEAADYQTMIISTLGEFICESEHIFIVYSETKCTKCCLCRVTQWVRAIQSQKYNPISCYELIHCSLNLSELVTLLSLG